MIRLTKILFSDSNKTIVKVKNLSKCFKTQSEMQRYLDLQSENESLIHGSHITAIPHYTYKVLIV